MLADGEDVSQPRAGERPIQAVDAPSGTVPQICSYRTDMRLVSCDRGRHFRLNA